MQMFHVTMKKNLEGINASGINPAMSQGKLLVSWYVELPMIEWAIAHVAKKHKVKIGEIVVLKCDIYRDELIKTKWSHVWAHREVCIPDGLMTAKEALAEAVERDERDYIPF